MDPLYQAGGPHVPTESAGITGAVDGSQTYVFGKKQIHCLNSEKG